MDHLISLYETAPLWARAESLADIAFVLGRCLEVRLVFRKKDLADLIWNVVEKIIELVVFAPGFEPRTFGDFQFEM